MRRTYVRPMEGWWRKNPFFLKYMAREVTAVFVYLYALALVWGLVALSSGEAAFNAWLEALRSPLGLAFQLVCLAVFAYHTWSWFVIMPKTMPPILDAKMVTAIGVAAALVASLGVLVLAR